MNYALPVKDARIRSFIGFGDRAMTLYKEAASILSDGGIIAYPTEGVWGLGCDPFNDVAVHRILTMKGRSVEKGLILVAGNTNQVEPLLACLPENDQQKLLATWPGPHTWLIPDIDQLIPAWIKGQFDTVAIRVSAHPPVVALCKCFDGMLVSTSANPADKPPALSRQDAEDYFPAGIDLVIPGELGDQQGPSEIRDLLSLQTIR